MTVSADQVRSVVAAQLPRYRVDSVAVSGAGSDNTAFEVNGELIVRFSKEPDPAARADRVIREARLLAAVADISPIPVPRPTFTVAELGCLAYFKIPGVPLLDVPEPQRMRRATSVAAALGELLTALHAAPVDRMAELVDLDEQPMLEWRSEAAANYAAVAKYLPMIYRHTVEAWLATPPPADTHAPAFSHNDLGIEHVLVDPAGWPVTGVIDWSDAAIIDPAFDFGRIHRDLGPAAVDAALRSYGVDIDGISGLRERAAFFARCSVLEDLAYGMETGQRAYIDKCRTAMAWLYPK
ncbi:MAG: phosphotransferase family protein [Jiangellaceae bacterium]